MPEVIETIKLCEGFKMVKTNPLEYLETEDWQEIRTNLSLPVDSKEWDIITREVFCFGHIEFKVEEETKLSYMNRVRNVYIEVIPVKEVN